MRSTVDRDAGTVVMAVERDYDMDYMDFQEHAADGAVGAVGAAGDAGAAGAAGDAGAVAMLVNMDRNQRLNHENVAARKANTDDHRVADSQRSGIQDRC